MLADISQFENICNKRFVDLMPPDAYNILGNAGFNQFPGAYENSPEAWLRDTVLDLFQRINLLHNVSYSDYERALKDYKTAAKEFVNVFSRIKNPPREIRELMNHLISFDYGIDNFNATLENNPEIKAVL